MDRKKFNSQLGIFIGFLILISFVYILFLKIPRKVSNFKVNEEIFYEGKIVKINLKEKENSKLLMENILEILKKADLTVRVNL